MMLKEAMPTYHSTTDTLHNVRCVDCQPPVPSPGVSSTSFLMENCSNLAIPAFVDDSPLLRHVTYVLPVPQFVALDGLQLLFFVVNRLFYFLCLGG